MNKKIIITLLAAALFSPNAVVFAQTSSGTTTGTTMTHGGANIPCVQSAVDVREGAIGDAFSAFSSAESAALSARKSALHDAWGLTDATARRTARNKAWSDFHAANKAAYTALRTAKKAAWSAFEAASKACKAPVVESAKDEGTGSLGL